MVTKGVRMDMSSIRIFNRMLMLVIILERIIIDLKGTLQHKYKLGLKVA